VQLGGSDTQLGSWSDLESQLGLVEAIFVHEELIVSGSCHLGLIVSIQLLGGWRIDFVRRIVSSFVFWKWHQPMMSMW